MRKVAAILMALVVAACSVGPDQAAVVDSMTDEAIVPSLAGSTEGGAALAATIGDFCSGAAAQEVAESAWADARERWGRAWLPTWFGPAEILRTVSRVDYEPISEDGIDRLLESAETLDADYVRDQAASTERGLGAVEYLLFGGGSTDPARRCELLVASAEVIESETLALEEAWVDTYQGGGAYADLFRGGSMTPVDALGDVVSAIVETLKQQTLFEVGKALGISSPEPEPEMIPEGLAGAAADRYRWQLESISTMLQAGQDDSLQALIRSRAPEVMDDIEVHLAGALEELEGVELPMRQLAVDDPAALQPLYDHLAALLTLFEADVVSALDITLGFSDADGDSG